MLFLTSGSMPSLCLPSLSDLIPSDLEGFCFLKVCLLDTTYARAHFLVIEDVLQFSLLDRHGGLVVKESAS